MMSATPQSHLTQMPTAQVLRLGDLVSYQDGTVVSRTLLKHPRGTVTVLAFDAGQGLSEHTAAFDALVQMLDGKAEITIIDTPYHLEASQAIFLPANQPHALAARTPF